MKRTTEGLREVLFNELESYLAGSVSDDHVKAVAKLTGSILATVAKDLEAAKMLHDMNRGIDQPKSIADLHLNILLTNSEDD